jgi:hypothetical protein
MRHASCAARFGKIISLSAASVVVLIGGSVWLGNGSALAESTNLRAQETNPSVIVTIPETQTIGRARRKRGRFFRRARGRKPVILVRAAPRLPAAAPVLAAPQPVPPSTRALAKKKPGKLPAPAVAAVAIPIAPFPATDSGRLELAAGGLTASVTQESVKSQPAEGELVYASVVVQGSGPAELRVDALGGKLLPLLGTSITTGSDGTSQIARFDLGENGRTAVTMELKADDKARSRLRVTLSSLAGGATDSTVLGWKRSDCAADFHAAVQDIRGRQTPIMSTALDNALAEVAGLSGRWMYGPPDMQATAAGSAANTPKCLQWAATSDSITGEKKRTCKKYKGPVATDGAGTAVDTSETTDAEMIKLADTFVRSKLRLKAFEKKRALRYQVFDLLTSMRHFLDQPSHPFICAGTPNMLEYYTNNTQTLAKALDRINRAAERANAAAAERVAAATGMESAALALVSTAHANEGDGRLRAAIGRLAQYILVPGDAVSVAGTTEPLLAFQKLDEFMSVQPTISPTSDTASGGQAPAEQVMPLDPQLLARREASREALSTLEVAVVLDAARRRFRQFDDATYGTIAAVRAAHKKACTCSR